MIVLGFDPQVAEDRLFTKLERELDFYGIKTR